MAKKKTYIAIDLKSFYASVECAARKLDPLTTNLVVADVSRTEKTICLAVSPSLKAYGIPGRARLFEVVAAVKKINADRKKRIGGAEFRGKSADATLLATDPYLELDYIAAVPRMKLYEEVSSHVYSVYLRYVAPEDIHVYSIDEVFMDVTAYLNTYQLTAHDLAMKMIREVLKDTGITATAGIADNMYLCKVAMDIVAKHIPADKDGVRIAELDEISYREKLWDHRPLTDFWRVGGGIARRLENAGIYTMGDIASLAIADEDYLYRLFGINAEYLIDHAFGYENTTIADVKAYKPKNTSMSSGQVLQCPYTNEKAKIIVREMTELLALDLVDKGLLANQIVLYIGYDRESLKDPVIRKEYKGEVAVDFYGRMVPKHAGGSSNLGRFTSSAKIMTEHALHIFEEVTAPELLIRRINITAVNTIPEDRLMTGGLAEEEKLENLSADKVYEQMDFFDLVEDPDAIKSREDLEKKRKAEEAELKRERRAQEAMLRLKKKYGKNAVLKGTDLQEGANTIERNRQIGGHKA